MRQVGDEGQGRKAKRAGQGALRKGGGVKPWLQIHSWPCRRHQLLSAELLLAPQFATQTKVCRGQHISLASLYPCAESALPTRGIPLVA